MNSDRNLPKDTSSSFIQDFADLQIPKISDNRICFKQNRTSCLLGVGEDTFHFLRSRILNKYFLVFLPLSYEHSEFSLIVSIAKATEENERTN